jgi:hypothetical protein
MNRDAVRNTLLEIPLIEERYGRFFFASIAFHGFLVFLILFGGYLLPSRNLSIGGSGPGGGIDRGVTPVGLADRLPEFSGGTGMIKPSLIPQPPALPKKPPAETTKAIPHPGPIIKTHKNLEPKGAAGLDKNLKTNIIPTAPQPGNGGIAQSSSGSGGGSGGGIGVSIGPGSGGLGDGLYAQSVANRISKNWPKPAEGMRVEMIYSFYIAGNGTLYDIKKEKSSGNTAMDSTAEGALFASYNPDPLPPPKPEFMRIRFVARFIYPSKP